MTDVAGLIARLYVEEDAAARTLLMQALSRVDVALLTDRGPYVEALTGVVRRDRDATMRRSALSVLVHTIPREVEALLAETLLCDLDLQCQLLCIDGLRGTDRVDVLLTYARTSTRRGRVKLLAALRGTEALVELLAPWDRGETKMEILDAIADLPALSAASVQTLLDCLQQEPERKVRRRMVEVLLSLAEISSAILSAVWLVAQDDPTILEALQFKATPSLEAFRQVRSTAVRIELLKLGDTSWLAGALTDSNIMVRSAAADRAAEHIDSLQGAVADALRGETTVAVRHRQVLALTQCQRFSPAVEERLVQCLLAEPDPTLRQALAWLVLRVAVTDANRDLLPSAWRRILEEPWLVQGLREAVAERLLAFAYQDVPELAACLRVLLLRTTDVEKVERYYDVFSRLEPNRSRHWELLLELFYRFAGHYPRAPLDDWLRTLHDLAAEHDRIRQDLPYLAQLTGANWILDAVDTSTRLSQLVESITRELRQDNLGEAQRLLRMAYEERTLRKKDLLRLFSEQIRYYDQYPLVEDLLKIMQEQQLFNAEVVSCLLQVLTDYPGSAIHYAATNYLQAVAPLDISYRERVVAAFTHANYRNYCRTGSGPDDAMFMPMYWTDSSHWRTTYPSWPVAELFFALEPWDVIADVLAQPVCAPPLQSLQYLLLHQLYRTRKVTLPLMRAVGQAFDNAYAMPELRDRALYILSSFWPELMQTLEVLPADMAWRAAEASADLIYRWQQRYPIDPDPVPCILPGTDLEALASRVDAAWLHQLWDRYADYLLPKELRWQPERKVPPHTFEPLGDAYHLIRALVSIDPVSHQAQWTRLLKLATQHHRHAFTRAVNELPPPRRRPVLLLIGAES